MNIFLTGATGYVGSGIAQALQHAGRTVIALARSGDTAQRLYTQDMQSLRGDLTDLASIARGALLNIVGESAVQFKAIAQAAGYAAGVQLPVEVWSPGAARQQPGPLVDALLLDQNISGARARSTLGWMPHGPSILEDMQHGSYTSQRG
jgi:uncharacterized protein YbjT (DUF2867 family)